MKKPKNYYCHKSQSFQSTLPLTQNLQIVQKIGEGAFGQVFKVFDTNSSELKVIKRHKKQSSQLVFNKQNQIMRQMSGSEGFAKVKQFSSQTCKTRRQSQNSTTIQNSHPPTTSNYQNKQNKNSINNHQQLSNQDQTMIMMQCLGDNLGKVVQKKPLSIYSMKRIAYQLILRLKQLHDKNYVHRDLKPQNILLGNQLNPHKIYLVDFGLVSSFRKDVKKIRKVYDGLIGTAKFCPLASHLGNEQFPIDDLQSLGYVLVYLVQGQLPWKFNKQQNLQEQQKYQKMKQMKQSIPIPSLVKGVNCLNKYFSLIKSLKPTDPINYTNFLNIFKTEQNIKQSSEYCFQFCKQNCFYKIKRLQMMQKINGNEDQDQESIQNNSKFISKEYTFKSKFIKK